MDKEKNRIWIFLAWLTVILCGCITFTSFGLGIWQTVASVSRLPTFSDYDMSYQTDLFGAVGLLCMSGVGMLILVILLIIMLKTRNKKEQIKPIASLEPTGASEDDPIPPTS